MDQTIHDVLDGWRAGDEFTSDEKARLAALEATIGAVAGLIHSAPVPDLAARVAVRIREMRSAPSLFERGVAVAREALGWLWTPRPLAIRMRPAYAVAALAIVSALAVLTPPSTSLPPRENPGAGAAGAPTAQVYVQFRLEVANASRVALAGSFTGWDPAYEMRERTPGTWSILIPLRPGIHDYAFVVDGEEWVADPHALQISDGFGGMNSRIALPSPPTGSRQS